ncbi:MAG: hypothetical protein LBO82_02420 [Synergistaceae bacterium]|nr:hypothetical protein [Synergistaceae bacterium]
MEKSGTSWKRAGQAAILAGFFCVLSAAAAFAAGASLDENEEVQWVMGDLSALKTAACAYYSENGESGRAPSLSEILRYFDENSLPPNAASLYSVRHGAAGWYVGYRAAGLKGETCRLLGENANTLELLCDDLRSPWRRGSAYIWSLALPLSVLGAGGPKTVIRSSAEDAVGTAAVMIGTAILLNIIDDHRHGGYYYRYPKAPWRWRSPLAYRSPYHDRFFGRPHHRPLPPRPRPRPIFRHKVPRPRPVEIAPPPHRGPSERDRDIRRPGPRPRPQPQPQPKPPVFRPGGGRRPESVRNGPRPGAPRPGPSLNAGKPRPGRVRPGGPKVVVKRPESAPPRREAPRHGAPRGEAHRKEVQRREAQRRRGEELRREGEGRGGPRR